MEPDTHGGGTVGGEAPPGRPRRRPDPLRWLWYAVGGRLPAAYRSWVLYDATTRTWVLRHLARSVVQLAVPVVLVLIFVPGPFWIRALAAGGGVVMAFIFSLAYVTETLEQRVRKAGYPPGTAERLRQQAAEVRASAGSQRVYEAAQKRNAKYRARTGQGDTATSPTEAVAKDESVGHN